MFCLKSKEFHLFVAGESRLLLLRSGFLGTVGETLQLPDNV